MGIAHVLFALGGAIIAALGLLHGYYTVRDEAHPRLLAPRDAAVTEAMRNAALGISGQTDIWRAWIGFNLSHSLGAVVIGGGIALLGLLYPSALDHAPVFIGAPLILAAYLYLSIRYWFVVPTVGIALGLISVSLGSLLA